MSQWVILQQPCLHVEASLVLEAQRAFDVQRTLEARAAPASLDEIERSLWFARALPVALDALGDMRASLRTDRLIFHAFELEKPPGTSMLHAAPSSLTATALFEVGSEQIEVRFATHQTEEDRPARNNCETLVTFSFSEPPDLDDTAEHINIRRFQVSGDVQTPSQPAPTKQPSTTDVTIDTSSPASGEEQ